MKKILLLTHITARTKEKTILSDISISFQNGKTYAIMGPNGSGKSTLVHAIMGVVDPFITVSGMMSLNKVSLIKKDASMRSRAGLFLSYQSPIAIPGVSVVDILRSSMEETKSIQLSKRKNTPISQMLSNSLSQKDLMTDIHRYGRFLKINDELLFRGIHDGFSGGERKKIELLQALILQPSFALFDEIDTGVDVDALNTIGKGIILLKKQGTGVILVTHYRRLLSLIKPDVIHILKNGHIVKTGNAQLSAIVEKKGYDTITQ